MHNVHAEEEEEYVLLDLDAVSGQVDIPPDAPYVLFVWLNLYNASLYFLA